MRVYLRIGALFRAMALVVLPIYRRRCDRRVQEFAVEAEMEAYTCPVCRMTNDTMNLCERCGFDPYTKMGGEDYVDEDLRRFLWLR